MAKSIMWRGSETTLEFSITNRKAIITITAKNQETSTSIFLTEEDIEGVTDILEDLQFDLTRLSDLEKEAYDV